MNGNGNGDNGNGKDITYKVAEAIKIAEMRKDYEHITKAFDDERNLRLELEQEIKNDLKEIKDEIKKIKESFYNEIKDVKDNYLPKWITYLLGALSVILTGETIFIITHL